MRYTKNCASNFCFIFFLTLRKICLRSQLLNYREIEIRCQLQIVPLCRLSAHKTHFYLDAYLVPRCTCKKSIRSLRISVIIFCEIAEHVASPGAGGNGTIHRFTAILSSRRVLYPLYRIFVTMRPTPPAIPLSRCAISAINFPGHRCQLSCLRFST